MRRAQFFTMSSFFFVSVLLLIAGLVYSEKRQDYLITQSSIVSSEVAFQNYNVFSVLGKVLKTEFTRAEGANYTNITISAHLRQGYDPLVNLNTYNNYLRIYESKIGITMNHSMTDLLSDVSANNRYRRIFYPANILVTRSYSSNTITYTNNRQVNAYFINLSFNGSITGLVWTPLPSGIIPVYVYGPNNYSNYALINPSGSYSLRVDVNNSILTDRLTINFNFNNNETTIDYSSIDSLDDFNIKFTTSLASYGNVFKILSPYPNTIVNTSFDGCSLSRRFE